MLRVSSPLKLRKTSYLYVHRGVEDKIADGDVARLEANENITDLELQQREGKKKRRYIQLKIRVKEKDLIWIFHFNDASI